MPREIRFATLEERPDSTYQRMTTSEARYENTTQHSKTIIHRMGTQGTKNDWEMRIIGWEKASDEDLSVTKKYDPAYQDD